MVLADVRICSTLLAEVGLAGRANGGPSRPALPTYLTIRDATCEAVVLSSKRPLRQLTAAELWDAFEADRSSRELRGEFNRRLKAKDAELNSEFATRLGKAEADLLPLVPKGLLTAVEMRRLKDRGLERYWTDLKQKCECLLRRRVQSIGWTKR